MRHLSRILLILLLSCSISFADTVSGTVKDWLGNTITTSNGNFSAKVYVFAMTGSGATLQLVDQAYVAQSTSNASTGAYSVDETTDCETGTTCLANGTQYYILIYYGGSHTAADGKTYSNLVDVQLKTAQ